MALVELDNGQRAGVRRRLPEIRKPIDRLEEDILDISKVEIQEPNVIAECDASHGIRQLAMHLSRLSHNQRPPLIVEGARRQPERDLLPRRHAKQLTTDPRE